MACCSMRNCILTVCALQLVTTVERQVFDFLGFMWTPIIVNFLLILFVILGIFAICQYRPRVIGVFTVWCIAWLGWNVFVVCFYLEIGILNRNEDLYIFNLNTDGKSWWLENGIGCHVTNQTALNGEPTVGSRKIPPERFVQGCLIDYYYVEIIHAAVQCLLCAIAIVLSCVMIWTYIEEDDSSTPVNDELEYVKMRYKSPARSSFRDNQQLYNYGFESTTSRPFENLTPVQMPNPLDTCSIDEHPPSYRASISENVYSADRRSIRSKASNKSRASTRNKRSANNQRPEDLPWVQITPSANFNEVELQYHN